MMVVLLIVLATVLTINANVAQQDMRKAPTQMQRHATKEDTRLNGDFVLLSLSSCEGGRSLCSVVSGVNPFSVSDKLCCTGGERMMVCNESSAPPAMVEEELLSVKLADARGGDSASLRGVVCNGRGVNTGGVLVVV